MEKKKKPVKPLKRKMSDAEIAGYINNKEEAQLKKTLWELMYNGFLEDRQLKRPTKATKDANGNGKNKPSEKESNKKQKKTTMASPPKRSSRINYDALKSMLGEDHGERESEEPKSKLAAEDGDGRSEELAGEEEEEGEGDYNNYGDAGLEDDEAGYMSDDDNLIW